MDEASQHVHEPPPRKGKASDNNFAFHRCVADRILSFTTPSSSNGNGDGGGGGGMDEASQHVQLPVWLVENLKERHGAALLDLYTNHKQFDDAIALVHALTDKKNERATAGEQAGEPPHTDRMRTDAVLLPYEAIKRLEAELAAVSRAKDIDFVHRPPK